MISIIDVFAGPGGLGEGFAAARDGRGNPVFDHRLSIEMEPYAFETLKLRTFFRSFPSGAPADYYRYLRRNLCLEDLYKSYPHAAKEVERKCWNARLGPGGVPTQVVRERIHRSLGLVDDWVLVGGPPCQAYSIAGRSRNQGNPGYDPRKDVRQRLYVEYLQILADHRPAVFIMENVKGLLSATLDNRQLFLRILEDLQDPVMALKREGRTAKSATTPGYRIFSLVEQREFKNGDLQGSVIQAEKYGVPQTRHRVILLGIRGDINLGGHRQVLETRPLVPMSTVIGSFPPLRSGLSRIYDSPRSWEECLRSQVDSRWANSGAIKADGPILSNLIRVMLKNISASIFDRGGEFFTCDVSSIYEKDWYCDDKIGGVCNHTSRGHMETDLFRYMYATCYAKIHDVSPSLDKFPTDLLPDHFSADFSLMGGRFFADRFRVQVAHTPSTTIMSHLSKDGHYYIHPEPRQCRSLTVREAARLQKFPDNYFFCGPRTAQYIQVGVRIGPPCQRSAAGGIGVGKLTVNEGSDGRVRKSPGGTDDLATEALILAPRCRAS